MKNSYRTLSHAEDELIIKKSRFKTFVYNVKSESEALDIICELRKRFNDATHVCYAYVLSVGANVERFSDDGEPSGTAGMPILEMIKNSGYSEVFVAVVRYFGGVKLGAGGLIRAYAECAKNCIAKASVTEYLWSDVYKISVDYAAGKKIKQFMSNIVCKTLELSYNDSGILMTVAAPETLSFDRLVTDFLSGRLGIEKVEQAYVEYLNNIGV